MPSPSTSAPLRCISSMATRLLLEELLAAYAQHSGVVVALTSVGGVDAAKRVQAAEPFDLVVLADDALAKLAAAGHVRPGSVRALVHSPVAVAVPAGRPTPDISTEAALRRAVAQAARIGYSTGPSGTALLKLLEGWGLLALLKDHLIQAPPGVPVGQMLATGQVDLGFQQLSELLPVQGITRLGTMPEGAQIISTFSGAVASTSAQPEQAQALLSFLASDAAAQATARQGMTPA
ncbi:substrate-binding domain-containing protein [Ideonella sp.]|uniref:substrate-binding domain-containing protein n=1 Tax=Ideonella sp. TaxID=1929293 RepID=UPI0037C0A00E